MKSIRSIAALMFFAVLFAVPAFAQTGATTSTGAKVAVVDTSVFADDKAGVTKFNAALKSLDTEFAPRRTELQNMSNQYNTLVKEIETLSKPAGGVPINQASLQAKAEQADKMKREIEYKQKDAQAAYGVRQEKVLGPIYADIGKAISDYAKQKGYALIVDLSKDQNQMVVWADMAQADITADFVKFYNARPAGTATTATPK